MRRALGIGDPGNADGRGTVARRIGQLHRRLETGHQALVAVGARVGERIDGPGMLDDAADIVERDVGQAAVLVAGKQCLAVLLQGLMHVHAAAVVADDGFRHESQGFSVAVRHVLQGVLENLHFVGFLGQRIRRHIDFALSGGGHFVVMYFELQTHFFAGHGHGSANVLLRVDGRHREVAALDGRPMTLVAVFVVLARIPGAFVGVHFVGAAVHARADGDLVENEEFVFRAEQRGVGDSGGFEIGLGALCQGARVALVALHGHRFDDVAAQVDRGFFVEGIDDGGGGVRHQNHVRLIDALPAGDGRTVEHLAVLEKALVHQARRNGDVVFLANRVGKAEIGELRFFFLDQFQNIGGSHVRPRELMVWSGPAPGSRLLQLMCQSCCRIRIKHLRSGRRHARAS